ncbi:MAG: D-alanyl-D-alanine carboxypeptidase [Clostridiales bacterium]|nr:D-alanyl-D-alanine carboxypeptidase [Clostridiales bacterium]
MRKWICVLLIIVFSCLPATSVAAAEEPKAVAQGAVLMDMETGRILWGKNEDQPMPMASTTKIMTALLVLEQGNLDDVVEVSLRAASAPKVHLGLKKGEKVRLGDLLYAMMLESSNDAAVAVAEHVGGSVENFCQEMTQRAKELGAKDTVFETPNGLDGPNHHSTAEDMARITAEALKNPTFCEIIQTPQKTFTSEAPVSKTYTVTNKDRLLREYEGAIGVKTGFTGKAGQCFVGAAQRDGRTLISVVLASGWGTKGKEQKWRDTKAILDYGFSNFKKQTVFTPEGWEKEIPLGHSDRETVTVMAKDSIAAVLSAEEYSGLRLFYSCPSMVEAPVKEGDKAGELWAELPDGERVGVVELSYQQSAERKDLFRSMKKIINHWCKLPFDSILE